MKQKGFQFEAWHITHPRWQELWKYICKHEPFPAEFTAHAETSDYFASVALSPKSKIIGYHLCRIQPIGPEMDVSEIKDQQGKVLSEAKVRALRVDESWRNKGIGTKLQIKTLQAATEMGCFQVRSRSSIDKVENYAIKIKLGFACHPAERTFKDGTTESGVYWVKALPDLSKNSHQTLQLLVDKINQNSQKHDFYLNPKVSIQAVEEAEKDTGKKFPNFYKEFLLLANGGTLPNERYYLYNVIDKQISEENFVKGHLNLEYIKLHEEVEKSMPENPAHKMATLEEMIDRFDLAKQQRELILGPDFPYNKTIIGHNDWGFLCVEENNDWIDFWNSETGQLENCWFSFSELFRESIKEHKEWEQYSNRPKGLFAIAKNWWQKIFN